MSTASLAQNEKAEKYRENCQTFITIRCAFCAALQVKQKDLTHMDATVREAANATRTAFGNDYESRLRSEAGAKPEKNARRKHQISSLYHAAKIKVCSALAPQSSLLFGPQVDLPSL